MCLLDDWQREASPGQWADRLDRVLDQVLAAGDGRFDSTAAVDLVGQLRAAETDHACEVDMDAAAVADWLDQVAQEEVRAVSRVGGNMAMGGFKPMRAIPCRVLAIMGLHDAAFPRRARAPAWDLLAAAPRRGDRDPVREDRQLFLDALLAAGDRVIVTATARNIRSNKDEPLSACVDEFLRVAAATVSDRVDIRETTYRDLIEDHPLQPFNAACFTGPRASFDTGHLEIARACQQRQEEAAPFQVGVFELPEAVQSADLELHEMIRILKDPWSAWLGSLGVEIPQAGDDPFALDREPVAAPAALDCLGAQLAISVNNCPPPRDPRSRMTSFKRTQRKYVQKAYRVRNWREYETGLRARGSLTVWLGLTDGKLANWNSPRPTRRKPGRQRKYSNHAIETTVTLGLVFGLASRQTEGFLRSRLTLLNLDNDVPDHSTISRRKARLGKVASYERRTVKPVHLLIDSSGLSVHVGQLRTSPKARDSRKLHLAVDEQTSDVVACELTSKRARDASRVASLVGQIERPIASAKADAAYDTGDVYKTLENHRAHRSPKVLIPPRKGAQLALDSAGTRQRHRNIRARSRVGKRKWYVASGDSRRSQVETTFHRYKAILGSAMRARGLASQRVEVRLGCKILNTMTALGIPDGEMIG